MITFSDWRRAAFFRSGAMPALGILLMTALLMMSTWAGEYPIFNVRVGTQTFGPLYAFTPDTRLVETAEAIYDMGSDIIKLDMSWRARGGYRLPDVPGITNLATLAGMDPSYRHVFDMPFNYFLVWAYPMGVGIDWRDGMDAQELAGEYHELYDLSQHFLQTYSGSGKTFLIGHWEGDWDLIGSFDPNQNPSPIRIQGLTDWLRIRQQAITDARAMVDHTNVFVFHYTEVNLVAKAMTNGTTIVNDILPHLTNDLISYSSYDTQGNPEQLTNALAYVASKARTTGNFYKDIFIGEYGFCLTNESYISRTPQEQADLSRGVLRAAAGWGCPFVLYWQMYDNETNSNGTCRGFWLIDNTNTKQLSYDLHRNYLGRAHTFKNMYRFWLDRNPDEAAFDNFCITYDTFSASDLLDQILDSGEFTNRWSNDGYLLFLFEKLFQCTSRDDADYVHFADMLSAGTNRRVVLDQILDSDRFTNRCPNSLFAEMVLGGTLQQDNVNPAGTDVLALSARLDAGAVRSALWREYMDFNAFYEADLDLRTIHNQGDERILTKYFFNYDRDDDGMPDAWERLIVNDSGGDGITAIEHVLPGDDYDEDGLANLGEAERSTDPVDEDSDDDGLSDGEEAGATEAFVDPLNTTMNLDAVIHTRTELQGFGTVAFIRTNSTPVWSEAIVDWQRGHATGSLFSITHTPIVLIDPAGPVRDGEWQVTVQFFNASAAYLGEPNWIPYGRQTVRAITNAARLAMESGMADAATYRLRFRIGPSDNGDTNPGFLFTEIAALPEGWSDPLNGNTDGDLHNDLQEAIAGTDSTNPGDLFGIEPGFTWLTVAGQVLSWKSITDRTYRVSASPALAIWNEVYAIPGTGATMSYTNPLASQSFECLRLAVERN